MLRENGQINIIEFKKRDDGPGPPRHKRLDSDDLTTLFGRHGFTAVQQAELGEYTYLMKFIADAR